MVMDRANSPGDKLPSLRSTAMKIGCSYMTVVHAVRELAEEGILETREKSGIFIAQRPDRGSRLSRIPYLNTLYFFCYPSAFQLDSYHMDIFQTLSREAEWKRWNIRSGNLADEEEFLRAVNDPNACGIVLQATGRMVEAAERYPDRPLISYGIMPSQNICSVFPDNYRAGWDLAGHLRANGWENIGFATPLKKEKSGLNSRAFLERMHGAEDRLADEGVPLSPVLPWSVNGMTGPVTEFLRELRGTGKRSALIVTNCSMAKEIYLAAKMMNLNLPEDLFLASFIHRHTEEFQYPIPCMEFSRKDMASAILQLIASPELLGKHEGIMLPMTLKTQNLSIGMKT